MLGSREAHLIWPFGSKSHPHHFWASATGLKSLVNNCKRKRKRVVGLVPHFCTRDDSARLVDLLLDSSPAAGSSTRPPRAWLASCGQSTGTGRASVALFLSTRANRHRTATQTLSPRSLSPWPGSLCANGHVCQVNSLCRTAVTPSPSPPSLPSLARSLALPLFCLPPLKGRPRYRSRAPAIALHPFLPPLFLDPSALSETVCATAGFVSVSAKAVRPSVRPSFGRMEGGLARAPRTCRSAIRRRILVCLKLARIRSRGRCRDGCQDTADALTDRPTVQPR